MTNIVSVTQAGEIISKLQQDNKRVVLVGGCFDIFHVGHLALLKGAKEQGDSLFVMLESDERIASLKGDTRPIFTQTQRAEVLAALRFVDFVILLPNLTKNEEYDRLIGVLRPDVIAIAQGDDVIKYAKRQAESVGAKLAEVTAKIPHVSSTHIIKAIEEMI